MTYLIFRRSDYMAGSEPPCPSARIAAEFDDDWSYPRRLWTVEVDDLTALVLQVGKVVLHPPGEEYYGCSIPVPLAHLFIVEVYDAYRE